VVDEHIRECPGGRVDRSITGDELIDELDRLAAKVDWLPAQRPTYVPGQLRNCFGTFPLWNLCCGHWRTRAGGQCWTP
jgi:hypothetical protein